ncbi:glycosyltransferase family 2 protein [Roseateles sp.]|jgi:glycosyltransferase involved in cell wall biosynthesis|uniref:glycosyltransferase family 2 protein n=1 Tax=Roseateles sp. TaxID=1971397 RepID=UPI003BAB2EFE
MTPEPLISIVCCTHNRLDFVRTHLEALKPQLQAGLELLYALDHCTDGTRAFLQEATQHLPGVRIAENDGDRGLFNCRNFGLTQSRGQFIHFLDDDDGVEADFYARALASLAALQGQHVDLYLTALHVSEPDHPPVDKPVLSPACLRRVSQVGNEQHLTGDLFRAVLDGQIYFNGANTLFSRALLQRYGFRGTLKKSADWLFSLEASLGGDLHIVYNPTLAAKYFVHSASMSLAPDKAGWNAKVFDTLLSIAPADSPHRDAIRKACAMANFHAGYAYRRTDMRQALALYGRAFRLGLRGKSALAGAKLLIGH